MENQHKKSCISLVYTYEFLVISILQCMQILLRHYSKYLFSYLYKRKLILIYIWVETIGKPVFVFPQTVKGK
jgi:hypothetical protein